MKALLKVLLWKINEETTLLVDPKEVDEKIYLGENNRLFLLKGKLSKKEQEAILAKLREKEEEGFTIQNIDIDELEEVLTEIGINEVNVSFANEYIDPHEDVILFDPQNETLIKTNELEVTRIHEYWDGSNWRKIVLEPYMLETVVEITEDSVCLDEWDGQNWQTGGRGLHQYIHRIVTIDGEEADKDLFLLVYSSQWQGSRPTSEILTLDEIKNHLEKLGRDVEKYMHEIETL